MTPQEELAQLKKEQEKRNAAIAAQNEALRAQLNANAQALAQQQAQNEAAIEAEQQRQQQNFADIALQYKKDYDDALADDAALRQQEDKRAVWTGVTEGLASLANLVGVGSFDSANQTYHSYSKDWMDKADQERRIRRNRIDNIRDRQRAMDLQLQQLRGNQNMQILNLRGQNADKRYAAANQAATTMAGLGREDANRRAADAAQNASMAINQGNADRQFNEAVRARKAQEAEARRNNDLDFIAAMARQGYVKDAYGNWIYSGKGSGSGSGNPNFSYDATIDGQYVRLDMNKNTFEQAVNDGRAELREDAARMAGYDSWKDMMSEYDRMSARKKTRKNIDPELQQFVSQLRNGSAQADQNTISFVNEHRAELNNFNKHLLRVSSSSVNNGMQTQTPAAPASAPATSVENNAVEDKTGGAAAFFFGK